MYKKRVATMAVLLLILPAVTCSPFRRNPSYKWHLTLEIDPSVSNREKLVPKTVEVLQKRLDQFGLAGARVEVLGEPKTGRIRVNLPDVKDPERIKGLVSSQGLLQLVHIVSDPSPAPIQTYSAKDQAQASLAADQMLLPYSELVSSPEGVGNSERWVIAKVPPIIDGKDLRDAQAVSFEDVNQVTFSLSLPAATKFGIWTAANINEYIGVVLNNKVHSIAFIKSQIFDSGVIEGHFTKEAAEDLAQILRSGPLPAPVKIVEEGGN